MKKIKGWMAAGLGAAALCATAGAQAQDEWAFEFTPYLWASGIDGDLTVRDRTAKVEMAFSDLLETVDLGFAGLFAAQHDQWVYWLQTDYMKVSTKNLEDAPDAARLDTDMFMGTGAVGQQFEGFFGEESTIDVLLGIRYLHLKNELDFRGTEGTREGSIDIVDPTLLIRPSVLVFPERMNGKLRFNPTMGIGGGGDSDFIYELQPQFQYTFTNTALRFGYRRLHYKVEGKRNMEFDGAFQGFLIGFGWLF